MGGKPKKERELAWHFLRTTDGGQPYLLDGRMLETGVWLVHEGPIEICCRGYHASTRAYDALRYAPGTYLTRVEVADVETRHEDKLVCRRRKALWGFDAKPVLRAFARRVAKDCLDKWQGPVPQVVLDYLETGDESLREAARAATTAARSAASAAWVATAARAATAAAAVWAAEAASAAYSAAWAAWAAEAAESAARAATTAAESAGLAAAAAAAARSAAESAAWSAARSAASAASAARAAESAAWAGALEKYNGWLEEMLTAAAPQLDQPRRTPERKPAQPKKRPK